MSARITPRLAILTLCALSATAVAQDFTIDFRSHPNNPHPPIPQCQVEEKDDPPYPDTTGDCLYGLFVSTGQPIECLEAGGGDCPALTVAVPPPNLMFSHSEGLGVVNYDITDSETCASNCASSCLIGEDCGLDPDSCFCDLHCCTGTPSPSDDWKDGLDFEYQAGVPSNEDIRLHFGVPTLLSGIGFWRAAGVEMTLRRSDCHAPLTIDFREGSEPGSSGDGLFTFPGDGFFLPQNATLTIATASFRPFSTNDRIALQEIGVTRTVRSSDQEIWRSSCPFFAVPFDQGLTNITGAEWTVVDDGPQPGFEGFRSTSEVSTQNCGRPNTTGGAEGAVCYQSPNFVSDFDTSLISRPVDLSAAAHPVLRLLVDFQRVDELLEILTSTDGGTSWDLRATVTQTTTGPLVVALQEVAGEPSVQLRLRYHDPSNTDDGSVDWLVLDDILIYSADALFADGFETGNLSAWASTP